MSQRSRQASRVIVQPPDSLGVDGLKPDLDDDQGLSLEELGQTYAALLNQGADPYVEAEEEQQPSLAQIGAGEPLRVLSGDDDQGCEIAPRSILEAILFVGHPLNDSLTSEKIASLMRGVTPAEIDDLVVELNEAYAAAGRPYCVASVGAGYQLVLRPEYAAIRDKFYGKIREARLSQTALDVLAIVAYNQPVTHEEIDRIRGRDSAAILSQLVRRDLLAIERTGKGKPSYRTTERFLDLYRLQSLDDLPQVEPGL